MRRSLLAAAALVLSITGCIDDSPTASPQEIQLQLSNVSGCHVSGDTAVIDSPTSNCAGCAEARAGTADWSKCINTTAHSLGHGGTLQFRRGVTYPVRATLRTGGCGVWSDALRQCTWIVQHNNVRWEATGSGARPIIRFDTIPPGEGDQGQYHSSIIVTGHNVSLVRLDIQGTHYNETIGAEPLHEHHGIAAGNMAIHEGQSGPISPAGLLLDSVQVNGFHAHGLLWSGTDLTIRNSQFRYNSMTALALFHDGSVPTSGVVVRGTDISDNGGDGIDMTSSYALIEHDTIRRNGWAIQEYPLADWMVGERMGIILNPAGNAFGGSMMDSVTVRNNIIAGNERSGIILISDQNDSFNRIKIDDNVITGHTPGYDPNSLGSGMGVWYGKKYVGTSPVANVSVFNSYLRGNCGQNNSPNWNVPSSSFPGVTAQDNTCTHVAVEVSGPYTLNLYQTGRYSASVQNGTPPYTYEWRRQDCPVGAGSCYPWGSWHSTGGQNYWDVIVYACGVARIRVEGRVTESQGGSGTGFPWQTYINNPQPC